MPHRESYQREHHHKHRKNTTPHRAIPPPQNSFITRAVFPLNLAGAKRSSTDSGDDEEDDDEVRTEGALRPRNALPCCSLPEPASSRLDPQQEIRPSLLSLNILPQLSWPELEFLLHSLLLAHDLHNSPKRLLLLDGRPVATLQEQLVLLHGSRQLLAVPGVEAKLPLEELLLGASVLAQALVLAPRLPIDWLGEVAVAWWELEWATCCDKRGQGDPLARDRRSGRVDLPSFNCDASSLWLPIHWLGDHVSWGGRTCSLVSWDGGWRWERRGEKEPREVGGRHLDSVVCCSDCLFEEGGWYGVVCQGRADFGSRKILEGYNYGAWRLSEPAPFCEQQWERQREFRVRGLAKANY
ncbi:hypothetical protein BKA61DRAFT_658261 [Leptodontidium sp. MPI-SDFR-AT-0119]|nr:hypothetical protein BKA61DRAFT_658261 [Leptodontidium sp. MPI-SDFR-AT-0119]